MPDRMTSLPRPVFGVSLSPRVSDAGVSIVLPHDTFKLSDEAKRKLAEIDRRQALFWQTAHLYMFD